MSTEPDEQEEERRKRGEQISSPGTSTHIDPAYTADFDDSPQGAGSSTNPTHTSEEDAREHESSLKLQGGDINRDIFKISAWGSGSPMQRAQTFSHPGRPSPAYATEQRAPGGFRRHFVQQKLLKRSRSLTAPITSNFVHFLELYGSFAGEDLAESAVESDEEERLISGEGEREGERMPLLGRRKTTRGRKPGDASLTRTFFLLIKSFIGTGVLFLPKAFKNGGLAFSLATLVLISLIPCLAFHLLLKCRAKYGGGYGDIAEAIGGKGMRSIPLASITLSQLGFFCAGIIFTAENLYSFLEAVIKGSSPLPITALIGIQLIVLDPLTFIRDISKLGGAALLADVFILLGLGYIYSYDISTLATEGMSDIVKMFNPRDFTLTIDSAIFTFEGIGLILPIQSSMKEPQRFASLLYTVMIIITIIFGSVGALSYATFGDKTTVEIISNSLNLVFCQLHPNTCGR